MPEGQAKAFGLPCDLEQLRKPVQSIPQPASSAERREERAKVLEGLIKDRRILADVWKLPDFRAYCHGQMKIAHTKLMQDTEYAQMLGAQALARAWAAIIRDFESTQEHVRQLESQLSEIRTGT